MAKIERDYTLEKVTDYAVMQAYGLMRTPGLIIDETLVTAGQVLSPKQKKICSPKWPKKTPSGVFF